MHRSHDNYGNDPHRLTDSMEIKISLIQYTPQPLWTSEELWCEGGRRAEKDTDRQKGRPLGRETAIGLTD